MKVHHITEAPRIDPPLGNSRGTVPSGPTLSAPSGTSSLPKSVDIKPGVLDSKGNKGFNVVDQDGKVIKRFTGPSAEADANTHRDNLKKQIRAAKPKTTKATSAGNAIKPDADEIKPNKKIDGGIWDKIKFGGKFIRILLGGSVGQIAVQYMNLANINSIIKEHYKIVGEHSYTSQQAKDSRRDMAWAITDLIVEGLGGLVGGILSTWAGIVALGAMASTGIGIVLVAVIGGIGAIGAAVGTSELLKLLPGIEQSIHGFVVDILSKHFINRKSMEAWGKAEMSDVEFAIWFGMLYPGIAVSGIVGKTGEYVIDDSDDNDNDSINEQDSGAIAKKDAIKLVKSAPKGVENFNKGKELIRQAMAKQQDEKAKKADL